MTPIISGLLVGVLFGFALQRGRFCMNSAFRDIILGQDFTLFKALAVAILGGLLRFLDFDPNPAPKTEFDLGPAANYPLNSRTLLSEPSAVLLHTESGFSALSLICTHLGCTVKTTGAGFECPCHESRFDPSGQVTHGPAGAPLRSLRVDVNDKGNVIVYLD